jgi:galactokinase
MRLEDWHDRDDVVSKLIAARMHRNCAVSAARCFAESAAELYSSGVNLGTDVVAVWAPGRIEVFGKHTDYCGGESILAAVERGFCMIAVPSDDTMIRVADSRLHENIEFAIGHDVRFSRDDWSNYPQTVVRRLAKNFPQLRRGANIAFSSNLPRSSGLSSSSAFVVGTLLLLSDINGLGTDKSYNSVIRTAEDLAGYAGTVENGMSFRPLAGESGVGTHGGSEDHTAILCAQVDKLVQYQFCPVRFRRSIAVSEKYVFAIASSGVVAAKTGSALEKYNRLSALARAIVERWQQATGRPESTLASILALAPDSAERLNEILRNATATFATTELTRRLDHFMVESQLICLVPDTIEPTTIDHFQSLARQSHDAATRLLANQTDETSELAASAERFGALAASAFGAGFGGSVWALIDRDSAQQFLDKWRAAYAAKFPEPAGQSEFFLTRPATPAKVWR